jgi:hypothetical protein
MSVFDVPLYYNIEMETSTAIKNMLVIKDVALKKLGFGLRSSGP